MNLNKKIKSWKVFQLLKVFQLVFQRLKLHNINTLYPKVGKVENFSYFIKKKKKYILYRKMG